MTSDPFAEFEVDPEELRKQWGGEAGETAAKPNGVDGDGWGDPDMRVARMRRRDPAPLPIEIFGPWAD
jgi:hypothetical protein